MEELRIQRNTKNCINQNKGVLLLTLITLSPFSSFPLAVLFAKQSNLASEGKVNLHRLSYFQTKSLRESCRSASACCCCLAKIGKQGFLHQQRLVCDYQPVADCFIFTANAPHNKLMRQTLFFRTDLRFSLQTLPAL